MGYAILRKVPYKLKLPAKNQIRWAFVLSQQQGVSLLFVPRQNDKEGSHTIAIAAENVREQVFENVNTIQFDIPSDDVMGIANKLEALAEHISRDEFRRNFSMDDSWND